MMKRTGLIFNEKAGMAAAVRWVIEDFTRKTHCSFHVTTGPEDAKLRARQLLAEGARRIIVAGGDGTISQVVNGVAPDFAQVELAVVPLGTANDLARSLGMPAADLETALSLAVEGRTEPIDLVRLTDGSSSYFINAATGGFGGSVASDLSPAEKSRWGALAYWITAARGLAEIHELQTELTLDGRCQRWKVYGVAVANGRYVGGGFPIAPRALLNDGWLDVTVIPALPTMDLLSAGLDYMLGWANDTSRVPTFRARRVCLSTTPAMPFSIDGEPTREVNATFEVVPGVLRMVAPVLKPAEISNTVRGNQAAAQPARLS